MGDYSISLSDCFHYSLNMHQSQTQEVGSNYGVSGAGNCLPVRADHLHMNYSDCTPQT